MKISLSSLYIITLLLCSCTAKKTDDAYYDYYNDDKNVNESKNMVIDAFVITSEKVEEPKAIFEIIE